MKIALAQINYHIGNFEQNTRRIIESIEQARSDGADLVVFAELAISGYPPRDFLEFDDFIDTCETALETIAAHCTDVAAIVGAPTRNPEGMGKGLFNSAVLLAEGKVKSMRHKSLLPNYDIFDEYRYFEPARQFATVPFKGKKIALTICEDLWDIGEVPLYSVSPMERLVKENPDLIINIAASPFHHDQARQRRDVLIHNAATYGVPLFYVNHVGAQTELLFDGGSMVLNGNGRVVEELAYFKEDMQVYDLEQVAKPLGQKKELVHPEKIALIHDALVMGIKNYFDKLGFSKAILGLSGGIDSAVTMALAARALGPENVKGVLLPSQFSSDHSIDDARKLAENLGSPYDIIPIEQAYKSFESLLKPLFGDLPFGLAEENLQARTRGVLLMALSNKFGYILLNTSNKSEAAVGYGTLYGDMCGGLSILGDVYKTEVFELARYMNQEGEVIPENTIIKPPSAELRPDQKDSDSLPDYGVLDQILFQYIEMRQGPRELIQQGFDEAVVKKTLRLVNTNEYKRYQTAPVLRVSSKAFGQGRRMPIVARYLA